MVKWADRKPQADDRKAEPPTPPPSERRLFMGLSSWTVTDEDVMQLVQQFGDVEEAYVMKAKGGTSKGCALVKFKDKAAGQRCIDELHEKHTFEGAERPIIVKWADPPKAQQPQPPMPMQNVASQPVLTLVQQQALLQQGILLGQQMAAQQQMAHQQWGYAPPTAPQAAYAAYAQPSQSPYETPVATDPYAAYYQQAAAHQDPYAAYYQQQAAAAAAAQAMQAWTGQAAQPQHQSAWATAAPAATPSSGNPRSIVPEGCSVFVYHVPPYWTDDNMKEQFLAYGNIVTAVVARDKVSASRFFHFCVCARERA
jgi:CUG-BP- and ETR3-like factor